MPSELPKILVVDDSALTIRFVEGALRGAGYQVVTRSNPVGTSAAIMRERPALVLLDLSMPLLDGDEVLRSLRMTPGLAHTKVLLYSDRPRAELERVAATSGADGFLQKTGDASLLVRTVRRHIGGRARSSRPSIVLQPTTLFVGSEASLAHFRWVFRFFDGVEFTDSGTDALRRVVSRDPPISMVCDAELIDLSWERLFAQAVQHDARWRERFILIADEAVKPGRDAPRLLRTPVSDATLERVVREIREGSP